MVTSLIMEGMIRVEKLGEGGFFKVGAIPIEHKSIVKNEIASNLPTWIKESMALLDVVACEVDCRDHNTTTHIPDIGIRINAGRVYYLVNREESAKK